MTPKPTKLWGNTVTVGGASRGDSPVGAIGKAGRERRSCASCARGIPFILNIIAVREGEAGNRSRGWPGPRASYNRVLHWSFG